MFVLANVGRSLCSSIAEASVAFAASVTSAKASVTVSMRSLGFCFLLLLFVFVDLLCLLSDLLNPLRIREAHLPVFGRRLGWLKLLSMPRGVVDHLLNSVCSLLDWQMADCIFEILGTEVSSARLHRAQSISLRDSSHSQRRGAASWLLCLEQFPCRQKARRCSDPD